MSQTVNGVTTNYVLDQAAGLTQVLQDGSNTYLYGNERIAQYNNNDSTYFLTDALGSVRQLVDSSGMVTLTKDYEPYGEVLNSAGSGSSSYGFTGEATHSNLVYLRARYYQSTIGRFLTRDTWQGDYTRPLSLNGWNYVEGNPTNFVDPSGMWRWWFPNNIYHLLVEQFYEGLPTNAAKQLEFPIPGTPFRHPDMFNSLLGDVYEIEP